MLPINPVHGFLTDGNTEITMSVVCGDTVTQQ